MAARAIAKATVAFGMVSIPVKVYGATDAGKKIQFNQLCPDCKAKPKQQYVCEACVCTVERADMLKGYEISKGKFLTFSADEIKALNAEATKVVAINEFIPNDALDPVYFEKPYYLGADIGGSRAYALLAEAMRRTERVAMAQFCLRGKQYLVCVAPTDKGLAMYQLRYAHEVREQETEATEDLSDAEVDLALRFVDSLKVESFDPSRYTDEVYLRQHEAILAKAAGVEIPTPAPEPKVKVGDLMAQLQASLDANAESANSKPEADEVAAATEAE
jgi:DNA end-binding protein Ku